MHTLTLLFVPPQPVFHVGLFGRIAKKLSPLFPHVLVGYHESFLHVVPLHGAVCLPQNCVPANAVAITLVTPKPISMIPSAVVGPTCVITAKRVLALGNLRVPWHIQTPQALYRHLENHHARLSQSATEDRAAAATVPHACGTERACAGEDSARTGSTCHACPAASGRPA